MATIVNERDVLIRSAPSRLIDHDLASNVNVPTFKGISLAAPGAIFRVAVNGDVSPTSITLTATPRGFSETPAITWSVVYGDLGADPVGTGLTYEMVAANMLTDVVTVQVSVTSSGMTYTDAVMFVKIQDGSIGLPGSRGTINAVRAITGTAWSSAEATQALADYGLEEPFDPIAGDVVTLHNLNEGFSEIRRFSGATWVVEAPAFPGKNILKGSVATEQLLVTGMAESLNADPNTVDVTAWTGNGLSIVADATAPNGATALRCAGQGTTVMSRRFPVNDSDNYQVKTWAKADSGSPTAYLLVAFFDASGAVLPGSTNAAGWTSVGDYHYFGLANQVMPTAWTNYEVSFGKDETFKVPAGARYASVGLISNFTNGTVQRISGMVCRRKIDGRVVVDGSLAARHVDTRGLTVRNELGEVLLDASGSNVPAWVVQVVNSGDPGTTAWARPADSLNRAVMRGLLVDQDTLRTSVTPSGNSVSLVSTSRDVYSVVYGARARVEAWPATVIPEGVFTLQPNTVYVLKCHLLLYIIGTPTGGVGPYGNSYYASVKIAPPEGSLLWANGGVESDVPTPAGHVEQLTYGSVYGDLVAPELFDPTFSNPAGVIRIQTGPVGGVLKVLVECPHGVLGVERTSYAILERIFSLHTPPSNTPATQGVVRNSPLFVVQSTVARNDFGAPIVIAYSSPEGQPYGHLFTISEDAVTSWYSDVWVRKVYDSSQQRVYIYVRITMEKIHNQSYPYFYRGWNTYSELQIAVVDGVSPEESSRWDFAASAEVISSSSPIGEAYELDGEIEDPAFGAGGSEYRNTISHSRVIDYVVRPTLYGEPVGPATKIRLSLNVY